MVITEIEIDNVKGINHIVLELELKPNRPNILVAPNGFGKSSIAIAFKSLMPNKIELLKENCYNENNTLDPKLTLKLSTNQKLVADKNVNEIKKYFDVHVINNQLKPKAIVQSYNGRTVAQASMKIPPTILISTIPQNVTFDYSLNRCKQDFGHNGKILPNISTLFDEIKTIKKIESNIDFHKFELKRFKDLMIRIKDTLNGMNGTATEIVKNAEAINLYRTDCTVFDKLCNYISSALSFIDNHIEGMLAAWEYLHIKESMGTNFRKAIAYAEFLYTKKTIDKTLIELNPVSNRFNIKSRIEGRSLIIEWPKAHLISNGQRDILTFIAKLMKCQFQSQGNCILVIDEFFDYLDDANLVAFQYYISTLINSFKKEKRIIFPILLTHLDPNYLKHFCFNDKRLNICYLQETSARISPEMRKLVANREDMTIKDSLDKYYFHYYPDLSTVDITEDFSKLALNKEWGKASIFKKKIDRELRLYANEDKPFDPMAVCFSIRIKIEENVYNMLQNETLKTAFLETHTTKEKLNFAQEKGVTIPETYYLLGIIYNHPLHSSDGMDLSKPLALKLNNLSIKQMIIHLWS